ncbi:MAG: Gfo/Idh/MocA family oxidoreductase [Verrucomicrobia bacterium]|nr:Gfo/Idh/MocA family oxidoreductase [Verrucomicrobiota bacterium]
MKPAISSVGAAPSALSRRSFLQRAAVAAAAITAPTLIPASALGRDGTVPPSERIIMGGIGVGNRGSGVLSNWFLPEKDVQFVAICDPQKARREKIKQMADTKYGNNDCKLYSNLREFLAERTDIDAVLSAPGDRWHALAAVWAMRSGKDIYSEKPSAMTIAEGQAVVETARRYGRVYQTGTQRLSETAFMVAYELAKTGRLGKVHTAYAHIAPWDEAEMRHDWLPGEDEPPKDECDWDQWLGPCPWRPYNVAYTRGAWRGHYDFHTSCIGEWGAHTFAQAMFGLDLLDTCPVKYEYVHNISGDGMVTTFANDAKMILSRGDKHWRGSCGMRFDGPEGWVGCADGYSKPDVSSPALLADSKKLVGDYVARTGRPVGGNGHARNFLDCVKSRHQTVSNAVVMHRSMSAVHAANICMWLKRDLTYDPVKEEFVNDAEANRLRSRAMRAPYMF